MKTSFKLHQKNFWCLLLPTYNVHFLLILILFSVLVSFMCKISKFLECVHCFCIETSCKLQVKCKGWVIFQCCSTKECTICYKSTWWILKANLTPWSSMYSKAGSLSFVPMFWSSMATLFMYCFANLTEPNFICNSGQQILQTSLERNTIVFASLTVIKHNVSKQSH